MKLTGAKRRFLSLCMILLCIGFTTIYTGKKADAAYKLNKKTYTLVKGKWFTHNNSGGYDVKFSRTKVKYYNRKNGKLHHTGKIMGCKKYKKGYLIKIQCQNIKYSYYIKKKSQSDVWFFGGWKYNGKKYSGSSSLHAGKWDD